MLQERSPYDDMLKGREKPLEFQKVWKAIAMDAAAVTDCMKSSDSYYQVCLVFNILILAADRIMEIDISKTSSRLVFEKLFDNASFAAKIIQSVSTNNDIKRMCQHISAGFLGNKINIEIAVNAKLIDTSVRGMLREMGKGLRNGLSYSVLSPEAGLWLGFMIGEMDPIKPNFHSRYDHPEETESSYLKFNLHSDMTCLDAQIKPESHGFSSRLPRRRVEKEGLAKETDSFKHTLIALDDILDIGEQIIETKIENSQMDRGSDTVLIHNLFRCIIMALSQELYNISLKDVDAWRKYYILLTKIQFVAQTTDLALTNLTISSHNVDDLFASIDDGLFGHQKAFKAATQNPTKINTVVKAVLKQLGYHLNTQKNTFMIFGGIYSTNMKQAISLLQKT
jgi:hypothetical protein